MMDSQENALNQGTIEEPQVEAAQTESPVVDNTQAAAPAEEDITKKVYATKQ